MSEVYLHWVTLGSKYQTPELCCWAVNIKGLPALSYVGQKISEVYRHWVMLGSKYQRFTGTELCWAVNIRHRNCVTLGSQSNIRGPPSCLSCFCDFGGSCCWIAIRMLAESPWSDLGPGGGGPRPSLCRDGSREIDVAKWWLSLAGTSLGQPRVPVT